MPPELKAKVLQPLIDLAVRELPNLTSNDRADLYDALALMCGTTHPKLSLAAEIAATALRDAEALQLNFTALLSNA